MGWIQTSYEWDWADADASFRKALDLEPGSARALRQAGVAAAQVDMTIGAGAQHWRCESDTSQDSSFSVRQFL